MKRFDENMRMVIQGDVCFTRVDDVDDGLVKMAPENGMLIVAHSETGHNHAFLEEDGVEVLDDPDNPFVSWLNVLVESDLKHYRSFDNHETIKFPAGKYRINRQREYTPEGYRRVAD